LKKPSVSGSHKTSSFGFCLMEMEMELAGGDRWILCPSHRMFVFARLVLFEYAPVF